MSTHVLDVSGQRALTVTLNDPARTGAQTPAKAGDDVQATLSGFSELRLEVPPNARLQRRGYVRRKIRHENGKPVKDPDSTTGEYLYDEEPYEALVLVLTSASLFGRTSHLPSENAPEAPSYESTPHTMVVAKRWGETPHALESGELLAETTVDELIALTTPDEA